MYSLGTQFEIDYRKAKSDKKAVDQGPNYRLSIISERIIRLEYSQDGRFSDKPTQLVRRRNIGLPDFSVRQDASILELTTKYFSLTYIKSFVPSTNLLGQITYYIEITLKDCRNFLFKLPMTTYDFFIKERNNSISFFLINSKS